MSGTTPIKLETLLAENTGVATRNSSFPATSVRCSVCGGGHASVSDLEVHVTVDHCSWVPYECVYCRPFVFLPTETVLRQHFHNHHPTMHLKIVLNANDEKQHQFRSIMEQSLFMKPSVSPPYGNDSIGNPPPHYSYPPPPPQERQQQQMTSTEQNAAKHQLINITSSSSTTSTSVKSPIRIGAPLGKSTEKQQPNDVSSQSASASQSKSVHGTARKSIPMPTTKSSVINLDEPGDEPMILVPKISGKTDKTAQMANTNTAKDRSYQVANAAKDRNAANERSANKEASEVNRDRRESVEKPGTKRRLQTNQLRNTQADFTCKKCGKVPSDFRWSIMCRHARFHYRNRKTPRSVEDMLRGVFGPGLLKHYAEREPGKFYLKDGESSHRTGSRTSEEHRTEIAQYTPDIVRLGKNLDTPIVKDVPVKKIVVAGPLSDFASVVVDTPSVTPSPSLAHSSTPASRPSTRLSHKQTDTLTSQQNGDDDSEGKRRKPPKDRCPAGNTANDRHSTEVGRSDRKTKERMTEKRSTEKSTENVSLADAVASLPASPSAGNAVTNVEPVRGRRRKSARSHFGRLSLDSEEPERPVSTQPQDTCRLCPYRPPGDFLSTKLRHVVNIHHRFPNDRKPKNMTRIGTEELMRMDGVPESLKRCFGDIADRQRRRRLKRTSSSVDVEDNGEEEDEHLIVDTTSPSPDLEHTFRRSLRKTAQTRETNKQRNSEQDTSFKDMYSSIKMDRQRNRSRQSTEDLALFVDSPSPPSSPVKTQAPRSESRTARKPKEKNEIETRATVEKAVEALKYRDARREKRSSGRPKQHPSVLIPGASTSATVDANKKITASMPDRRLRISSWKRKLEKQLPHRNTEAYAQSLRQKYRKEANKSDSEKLIDLVAVNEKEREGEIALPVLTTETYADVVMGVPPQEQMPNQANTTTNDENHSGPSASVPVEFATVTPTSTSGTLNATPSLFAPMLIKEQTPASPVRLDADKNLAPFPLPKPIKCDISEILEMQNGSVNSEGARVPRSASSASSGVGVGSFCGVCMRFVEQSVAMHIWTEHVNSAVLQCKSCAFHVKRPGNQRDVFRKHFQVSHPTEEMAMVDRRPELQNTYRMWLSRCFGGCHLCAARPQPDNEQQRRQHVIDKHLRTQVFRCKMCPTGESYPSSSQAQMHAESVHGVREGCVDEESCLSASDIDTLLRRCFPSAPLSLAATPTAATPGGEERHLVATDKDADKLTNAPLVVAD